VESSYWFDTIPDRVDFGGSSWELSQMVVRSEAFPFVDSGTCDAEELVVQARQDVHVAD